TGGDNNAAQDVFVRDIASGTTTLVSANASGTGTGNSYSYDAAISSDARFVFFDSVATDLVNGVMSTVREVLVRDLATNVTSFMSVNQSGGPSASGMSELPVITPDGNFVAFPSSAEDLVPGVSSRVDIYVRNRSAGTTTVVTVRDPSHPTVTGNGN